MKNLTAVEWLVERLLVDCAPLTQRDIDKAKQMEREQIINAYCEGKSGGLITMYQCMQNNTTTKPTKTRTMITANRNFANSITKGKQYDPINETENQFTVIDDQGFKLGLSKSFFDPFDLCKLFDGSGIVDIDFKNIER